MSRAAIFFATGFEEIEALTVVDILRRAGITADMVSVTGERAVTGSHKITVRMDKLFDEVDFNETDIIILPGGMPGTTNLEAYEPLMDQVDDFYRKGPSKENKKEPIVELGLQKIPISGFSGNANHQ